MKELFLSKIIENVVYTVLVAGILTAGILLFGYPIELQYLLLGVPVFYFLQYDLRQHSLSGGFQQAQFFLLSALLIPELVGRVDGSRFGRDDVLYEACCISLRKYRHADSFADHGSFDVA